MKIPKKIKSISKQDCGICGSVYDDYATTLNDYARMCDADNKIMSVSSGDFCRAFTDVAIKISYAKADKNADNYCMLAKKAVEMLVRGTSEADTLCYFKKVLNKKIGRIE